MPYYPPASPDLGPAYKTGRWYNPGVGPALAVGSNIGVGTLRLVPFRLEKPITVTDLAARLTTAVAASNFQLALYGSNPDTLQPTGAALASTTSISGVAIGALSATLAAPVTLPAGVYWAAINADTTGLAFVMHATNASVYTALMGTTTLASISSATAGTVVTLFVAQTFGTWPDLTSASLSETATAAAALVFFKAA